MALSVEVSLRQSLWEPGPGHERGLVTVRFGLTNHLRISQHNQFPAQSFRHHPGGFQAAVGAGRFCARAQSSQS